MSSNNDPKPTKSDQAAAAGDDIAGDNNMKKSSMQRDGADANGAKPKPPPRRKGKRSSTKHKKNSKRRVRNSNRPLHRPAIIPEARLVQAPLEYSFISDHEDEDEEWEIQESIRRHMKMKELIETGFELGWHIAHLCSGFYTNNYIMMYYSYTALSLLSWRLSANVLSSHLHY
eukprot:scaffold1172_cov143-Skeletonema_marinoi.AAC.6